MAWNAHATVGVVHIVTFAILDVLAVVLFFGRHLKFFPWFFLYMFCNARIASGVLLILCAGHQGVDGVTTATFIILQVGVIPLFIVLIGLIMLARAIDYPNSETLRKLIIGTRIFLVIAIGLLVAGTVLVAVNLNSTDQSILNTADKLIKAGFGLSAVAMGILAIWAIWLWMFAKLGGYSKMIAACYTACIPFLVIRFAYWWLSALNDDPRFNPVGGSIAALICMHTIPEWSIVSLCVALGYYLPPMKKDGLELNYHGTLPESRRKVMDEEEVAYGTTS